MILTRSMILTVLIGLAVITVLIAQSAAQPIPQSLPEEIAMAYGKFLWAPWRGLFSNVQPVDENCRAYALLSEQTKAKVSPREFIAYASQFVVFGAEGSRWAPVIMVGPVRMVEQTAIVTLTGDVYRGLGAFRSTFTFILRLIPESGAWRIVLTDEQIVTLQKEARENRRLEGAPQIPCVIPTSSP